MARGRAAIDSLVSQAGMVQASPADTLATAGATALPGADGSAGIVVVTHGNLLALLLRSFDPAVGYAHWERLTNPDVYRVAVASGVARVARVWPG